MVGWSSWASKLLGTAAVVAADTEADVTAVVTGEEDVMPDDPAFELSNFLSKTF